MKNNASILYVLLLIVGDVLAITLAFAIAYLLRFEILDTGITKEVSGRNFVLAMAALTPVWVAINGLLGLYSHSVYDRRYTELGKLLAGASLGILAVIAFDYFTASEIFTARLLPVYGLITGFALLALFRATARMVRRALFRYGWGVSNLLVVGDTNMTQRLVRSFKNTNRSGLNIVGTVGRKVEGIENYKTFAQALANNQVGAVVQTELYADEIKNNEILAWTQENHATYRFVPGNSDLFVGNIEVELVSKVPMVAIHQTALIGWGRIHKRVFDLIVGLIALIVLSPFIVLIGIIIKISDPRGAVFFRQNRMTRFDTPFRMWKFRTMKQEYCGISPEKAFAKMGKPELGKTYRENGDFIENDPRITSIGRLLRATSLDELPQLFNVIRGDLSLVGPRALVPEEIDEAERKHAILSVKSGITGLAQVSGRQDISFEERRRLDVYYVQNWSMWLDIAIILRTIGSVLRGKGAH